MPEKYEIVFSDDLSGWEFIFEKYKTTSRWAGYSGIGDAFNFYDWLKNNYKPPQRK